MKESQEQLTKQMLKNDKEHKENNIINEKYEEKCHLHICIAHH